MVAEARTWVDVEQAVREWARDNVPSVSRRVFFGANNDAAKPQIVLFRVFGTDDACRIQFDVWARTKAQAAEVAAALATAADDLSRYEFSGVLLLGARVETSRWLPDDESDEPRYVLEVIFTAYAAE